MNYNELDIDKVDDFLLGKMDEATRLTFKAKIEQSQELKRLVAQQEKVLQASKIAGYRELKRELQGIHKEVIADADPVQSEAKVRSLNWKPYLAAASILFLGVLGWWLFATPQYNSSEIFAAHYESFEMGLALRNGAQDQDAKLNKLSSLYKEKKYQESLPLFEDLLQADGQSAQLLMGSGIAKFETGDSAGALVAFNKVISSNNPFLLDEAKWYAAMVHLKGNKTKEALSLLQELADNPGADHHEAAQEIINKLK